MATLSPPDPRKPPSAPTATAPTKFSTPKMRSRRSSSSMCRPPAASATTQISKEFQQSIHGHCHREGQLAGAGLHRLPRHPLHQGAQRSEFPGVGAECRTGDLRALPRRRAALPGVRSGRPRVRPRIWPAITAWRQAGGSQVVANCASCHGTHSIFPSSDPRSTINQRESCPNLRTMPSGRDGKIHRRQGARGRPAFGGYRQQSGALDPQFYLEHDLCGDRRDAAAQLYYLAIEGHCAAQRADTSS